MGIFDIGGIRPVIGFCQKHKRPFLFVLTGTNPDAAGWPKLIREAAAALKRFGPVMAKTIRERAIYISTLNSGKTGPEASNAQEAKAAAVEIDGLWQALKKQAKQ